MATTVGGIEGLTGFQYTVGDVQSFRILAPFGHISGPGIRKVMHGYAPFTSMMAAINIVVGAAAAEIAAHQLPDLVRGLGVTFLH